MKSRTSGWSALRTTIFAARRVVPPDLIDPATESAPRMNDTGPEASPPPDSCSRLERIVDTLMPLPEPPLKMTPSVLNQSRIESIESSTERMKHADACWRAPSTPMLNQTGELKDARCCTRSQVSSCVKISASASVAKYPPSIPHRAIVPTTRSIICRTLRSRCGEPSLPRKYLDATTFLAVCDQKEGTSTSFCSNTLPPSPGMTASRSSHSISSDRKSVV